MLWSLHWCVLPSTLIGSAAAHVHLQPVEASFKLWSPASPDLIEEAIEIGGKGCHLVLFDMDGRWDMYRLAGMLRGHLERRVKEHCEDNAAQLNQARASPKEIESHVQAALGRILFFRPSSLISLAASIKLLPKTLEQGLTRGTVSLILIDSLTATYWQGRWDLEQARQEAEATPPAADKQPKAPVPSHPIRQVLRELGKLRKLYGFVTVMTTTAFTQESRGCPFYKPILPPPYPAPFSAEAPYPRQLDRLNPLHTEVPLPITHHLTVHAMPIPPMDKEVTREKALGEEGEKRRFIVNHRQAYRGYLRLAVSGSAPEHHNSSRAGAFDFKVIPGGIDA